MAPVFWLLMVLLCFIIRRSEILVFSRFGTASRVNTRQLLRLLLSLMPYGVKVTWKHDHWHCRLRMRVVPLSKLQTEILLILAEHRNPESYVAGASALNQNGPRYSGDIDIFHDQEEAVAQSAIADTALLVEHGFTFSWIRREPGIYGAIVQRGGESTKLEWVRDSDFRFFPTIRDELFGYRLHVADLATNKALAAAGRDEPRDVLDLLYIHEQHLPLGAVIWAAVTKDPGYSPESLITEIRRNARYRQDDYADLDLVEPVDASVVSQKLREALRAAETFIRTMPGGKEGLLFLKGSVPVQPDPDNLAVYVEHAGRRRGYWPSSSEIGSAMLHLDVKKQKQ
ncbi:hypothetical protein MBAV_005846 [Candidatus Magnetobacterium bavaricum]|uniref:Uncharacterized protein n=1 Tax=Candidatus Magnetobacterium bavaricum TaxID=29290 RepID=A0A0F3GJG0_9BACT|nr:hypothetical protein MBAV_005846 [Candidatus Magnetobacterium bavaricum]